jgi:geranylgeranyl diphosphate synthase, type I
MRESGAGAALDYLASRRPSVESALRSALSARGAALEAGLRGGEALAQRILEFCGRGKMIRGCLVFLGAEAAAGGPAGASLPSERSISGIAAAMELFQAGLLAHDDVMDRDDTRRGAPTIHRSYAALARSEGIADPDRAGESMATCLGDACYFEGFALLARSLAGLPLASRATALCGQILSEVALAQMSDVAWGSGRREVDELDILAMYRLKTARYTFALPLAVGALAAGSELAAAVLSEYGESVGIVFQLRDDELGLFGDVEATGKGSGGDVREGKKTLLRSRLMKAADAADRAALEGIFGNPSAGEPDIARVRALADSLGVKGGLARMAGELSAAARSAIGRLGPVDRPTMEALAGLVDYAYLRDR